MFWTEKAIKDLADQNPDGFTVDLETGEKVTAGVAVGMTHGLTAFDAALLGNMYQKTDINTLYTHRTIGGWRDGDKYIIDLGATTSTLEAALHLGAVYEQDAVYDIDLNLCINLKRGA